MKPEWQVIAAVLRDNLALPGFLVDWQGHLVPLQTEHALVNLLAEHRWLCIEGERGARPIRRWLFSVNEMRAWKRESTVVWCARVEGKVYVGVGACVPLQTAARFGRLVDGEQVLAGASDGRATA